MKSQTLIFLILTFLLMGCSNDDEPNLSQENKIISFKLTYDGEIFNGVIDNTSNTITLETVGLEKQPSLVPDIVVSNEASISPSVSLPQNFNQEIKYTVTAESGNKTIYTLIVINTPLLSNEKKILNFNFEIEGKIYEGKIDHDALTIYIEANSRIDNITPKITISNNASISPSEGDVQNFYQSIQYIVTAENNTSNIYTITAKAYEIYNNNPKFFYSNGIGIVSGIELDLSIPNSSLVLENNNNSYTLSVLNSNLQELTAGERFTSHSFSFPENIITASDYRIQYKINNEVKVESSFYIDVLAENIPIITSSNQTTYRYGDTLILYGNNLVEGLAVYAYNGSIYTYNRNYISVNNDKTELTFPITINRMMFPSYYGEDNDYSTRLAIYYEGRWGGSYIVDFD